MLSFPSGRLHKSIAMPKSPPPPAICLSVHIHTMVAHFGWSEDSLWAWVLSFSTQVQETRLGLSGMDVSILPLIRFFSFSDLFEIKVD